LTAAQLLSGISTAVLSQLLAAAAIAVWRRSAAVDAPALDAADAAEPVAASAQGARSG
jgi:hypothetical protein